MSFYIIHYRGKGQRLPIYIGDAHVAGMGSLPCSGIASVILTRLLIMGPAPGLHNWWPGDHVSVYDAQARTQIDALERIIDDAS